MISSEEMLPAENKLTSHQTQNQIQQPQRSSEVCKLTFLGFVDGFQFLLRLVNSSGLKQKKIQISGTNDTTWKEDIGEESSSGCFWLLNIM